ncbi:MAG: hypothetical protein ACE148_03405 [Vicinamibacterales bacterium]
MPVLKTFADGSVLEYARGAFDDHCVYLTRPGTPRHPPRDTQYFATLSQLAAQHGVERVYADFQALYDGTTSEVQDSVFERIHQLAQHYGKDALEVEVLFSVLYVAMVAEERRAFTKLGKRVKRLGVHQLLIEGFEVNAAANFSRKMRWREIAAECERRGF